MPGKIGSVRVVGSGVAVEGACEVVGLIFWPDFDADYVDVYDGLDSAGGKKFARIETPTSLTWGLLFPDPVPFETGVYFAGKGLTVETTVIFRYVD